MYVYTLCLKKEVVHIDILCQVFCIQYEIDYYSIYHYSIIV